MGWNLGMEKRMGEGEMGENIRVLFVMVIHRLGKWENMKYW